MTTVSTLLAPVMTPLLTYLLAGAWVVVSLMAMVISVTKVILVPVLLGLVIHHIFAANPLATLPGAIFSVWHNISGSVFASLRRAGAQRSCKE